LAHLPSKKFPANMVWLTCAVMAYNLSRALASLTDDPKLAVATPATIQRELINIPARIATSGRRTTLHMPSNWLSAAPWLHLFALTGRLATVT